MSISDPLRLLLLSRTRSQCVIGNGRDHNILRSDPAPTVGKPSRRRRTKRLSSVGGACRTRARTRRALAEMTASSQGKSVRAHTTERITSRNVSTGYMTKTESSVRPEMSQVVMKDEKKSRRVKAMAVRTPRTTVGTVSGAVGLADDRRTWVAGDAQHLCPSETVVVSALWALVECAACCRGISPSVEALHVDVLQRRLQLAARHSATNRSRTLTEPLHRQGRMSLPSSGSSPSRHMRHCFSFAGSGSWAGGGGGGGRTSGSGAMPPGSVGSSSML